MLLIGSTFVFAFLDDFYLLCAARFLQARTRRRSRCAVRVRLERDRGRRPQGMATGAASVTAVALVCFAYPSKDRAPALGILLTGRGIGAVLGETAVARKPASTAPLTA